jgi:hypothetical protein
METLVSAKAARRAMANMNSPDLATADDSEAVVPTEVLAENASDGMQ